MNSQDYQNIYQNPTILSLVLGTVGAIFSVPMMPELSIVQKIAAVIFGTIVTGLFAQPIIDLVSAPEGWANGISFLIGLIAWTLAGKTLMVIRKADIGGLIVKIVSSFSPWNKN